MFFPRSSAGYGSFQTRPQPARPQASRIAVYRAPRMAAKCSRTPAVRHSTQLSGRTRAGRVGASDIIERTSSLAHFAGDRMALLAGKRILVTGLLSNRSIAYGIAKAARREGAELAFTYQSDRFKERVTEMAGEFDSKLAFPCDVANDAEISALFAGLAKVWDGLDGLVHAIAFAPREAIAG